MNTCLNLNILVRLSLDFEFVRLIMNTMYKNERIVHFTPISQVFQINGFKECSHGIQPGRITTYKNQRTGKDLPDNILNSLCS
jgi:hypothetical protein